MDLILDTNALSAYVDGDEQAQRRVATAKLVCIPAVVLGEYRFGVLQSSRRPRYESWLSTYIRDDQVLEVDADTAVHYAAIRLELKRAGSPIPVNDLWIAALARQHRLPLLSRDQHFDRVAGLERIGW